MQACILKLIFDNELYDEITDQLLAFPGKELEFSAYAVQTHTQVLENISEQVSGFKQKMVIEINTESEQGRQIYTFLNKNLSSNSFQTQVIPLMEFKHNSLI